MAIGKKVVVNAPANKRPEVRNGDTIVVLHGKDAGKRGKVERVLRNSTAKEKTKVGWKPISARSVSVIVAGLNIAKRHTKPRRSSGQSSAMPQVQQGGIVEKPMPIDVSNVMIVCPHCDQVTRVKHETLGNGQRVRVCRHCNDQLEVGS